MKVYSGPSDIIWDVTQLGSENSQIAAFSMHFVVMWDSTSAKPVRVLPAENPGREHSWLSVSPDGKALAAHANEWLYIWNCREGRWGLKSQEGNERNCLARFLPASGDLETVQLHSDRVAHAEFVLRRLKRPREVTLEGKVVTRFASTPSKYNPTSKFHDLVYWAVDLAPTGEWFLLSAREKAVHVWNAVSGELVGSVKLRGTPNAAVFSPDGSRFAVDGGTTVYIHDTRTLQLITTWRVSHCYIPRMAWSPDGRWLARADGTTTVRMLNIESGKEMKALGARGHRATSINFARDGLTYLVGTFKGAVVVWDMEG